CVSSVFHVIYAANKSPAAADFADRKDQLIAALFQRKIDVVVIQVHDTEEIGVAVLLVASATVENLAVEKYADLVAITNIEPLHLVTVGTDGGARIHDFRAWLGFQALRKIVLVGS